CACSSSPLTPSTLPPSVLRSAREPSSTALTCWSCPPRSTRARWPSGSRTPTRRSPTRSRRRRRRWSHSPTARAAYAARWARASPCSRCRTPWRRSPRTTSSSSPVLTINSATAKTTWSTRRSAASACRSTSAAWTP
ncbi:MAG: hypothetical protein AVDCRST_MAG53-3463, partial [uncultured Solirubrobacteraceae bacterium]